MTIIPKSTNRGRSLRSPSRESVLVRWTQAVVLALLVTGLVASVTPTKASTQSEWRKPTAISPNLPSSWFPDISVDPAGVFRIAWAGNLSWDFSSELQHQITGAVMVSQLGNSGWTSPGDIRVMDAGIASRPLIASDGTYVHMIYRTGVQGTTTLNYMRALASSDLSNAHSWTHETTLSTGAYYAQIAVLPDQTLVVLYNEPTPISLQVLAQTQTGVNRLNLLLDTTNSTTDIRPTLFARRSTDHGITWSAPARISEIGKRVGRVSLASSPDGSLLVSSWDQGYDNISGIGAPDSVATAISTDEGLTWQHVQTITSPVGPIEQSAIATSGSTSVLVYRSTIVDKIYYRVSTDDGATWSAEKPIPDVIARPYLGQHNFDKLSMAVDGDGRILLAYVGRKDDKTADLSVIVTTFDDNAWTAPKVIATPIGYAEYPRIAVGLGNLLEVVYFVRDKEFALGHYTLWSVSGKSDAKSIPPVNPAPAPTPTAAATPTVTPISVAEQVQVLAPIGNYSIGARPEGIHAVQRNPIVRASLASLATVFGLLLISRMLRFVRNTVG